MSVVVVTPPEDVISLEEAKAHLRVDHTDQDVFIQALIDAATQHLDGPASWLGRALGEQELELRVDRFSGCPTAGGIILPYPPLISVEEITYIDTDGAEQTVAEATYRVIGEGSTKPQVVLAYSQSWPTVRGEAEAVRVRYRAGYLDTSVSPPVANVPAPIKAAILLMVGDLYANRETVVQGASIASIPMSTTVESLLANYRVY